MARAQLLAVLVLSAAAAAAVVAVAFVAPAGPRASTQLSRAAVASEAAPASLEALAPDSAATEQQEPLSQANSFLRFVGAGLVAGIVLAVSCAPANAAEEEWSVLKLRDTEFNPTLSVKKMRNMGLCKDNKKYHKRFKDNVYKTQQRQKKYPEGGVIWNRFTKEIKQMKVVEDAYGERWCGIKDGLPRVIASGELVRGNIVIPGAMFLYTTGWIGWTGRRYLQLTNNKDQEVNIDVPLALQCMASGFAWPVNSWQDIVNGDFVEKDENIWRSTRA